MKTLLMSDDQASLYDEEETFVWRHGRDSDHKCGCAQFQSAVPFSCSLSCETAAAENSHNLTFQLLRLSPIAWCDLGADFQRIYERDWTFSIRYNTRTYSGPMCARNYVCRKTSEPASDCV